MKVYPNLALPSCNLPDYSSITVEYDEYNKSSYIERGETSFGALV